MTRLSAILITRNEEADLPGCLEALAGLADELVVVDDGSADRTVEIAERRGARIFRRRLDTFGAQKQFALEQARGEWVLSVDADEQLTPALRDEIAGELAAPRACGYRLRRHNHFLGRRLRFGGEGGDRVLRLFRRDRARFTAAAVHERVVVDGPVAQLRSPLAHHPYRTLDEYVDKCNLYTALAAAARRERGRRFVAIAHLRPLWEFVARYVLRLGFLDGHAGLVWAGLSAHAAWLRDLKLRELERGDRG